MAKFNMGMICHMGRAKMKKLPITRVDQVELLKQIKKKI